MAWQSLIPMALEQGQKEGWLRTSQNTDNWGKGLAGNTFDPMNFTGLFGKKKKGSNADYLTPPPYEGERPYSGAQVGLGADALKPISEQYLKQISERSRGEGLVGFDPRYREILTSEFLQDLTDKEEDQARQESAMASSQGLRGGVPMTIATQRAKDFSRARASGLADIDIRDLEARRDDINTATYAQPEVVKLGSDIQDQRARFDLSQYLATMPTAIIDDSQSGGLSSLLPMLGSVAGSFSNNGGGSSIASAATKSSANKSTSTGRLGFSNSNDITNSYMDFLASRRRY